MPEWVPYLAAAVAYVAIGAFFPTILFAWFVGVGFMLICVVGVPWLVRRRLR